MYMVSMVSMVYGEWIWFMVDMVYEYVYVCNGEGKEGMREEGILRMEKGKGARVGSDKMGWVAWVEFEMGEEMDG